MNQREAIGYLHDPTPNVYQSTHSRDDSEGVCERTVEIWVKVHVLRQVTHERYLLVLDHLIQQIRQQGKDVCSLSFRSLLQLGRGGMSIDHEIEKLSS